MDLKVVYESYARGIPLNNLGRHKSTRRYYTMPTHSLAGFHLCLFATSLINLFLGNIYPIDHMRVEALCLKSPSWLSTCLSKKESVARVIHYELVFRSYSISYRGFWILWSRNGPDHTLPSIITLLSQWTDRILHIISICCRFVRLYIFSLARCGA